MSEIDVGKKIKEGWIKSQLFIEVLAVTEAAARDALEKHVAKLEKEKGVLIVKRDWKEAKRVEKPFQNIPEAYSYLVEVEVLTEGYEKLFYITIQYGPSSIEILEPQEVKLKAWEAQGIVNTVADMLHHFAAKGAGGIILQKKI